MVDSIKPVRRRYWKDSQAKFAWKHSLEHAFLRLVIQCGKEGWTQTELLERRNKYLVGNWERLSSAEKAEMFGYFNGLCALMQSKLVTMYCIKGIWMTPKELCDRKYPGIEPSMATSENCHWCHVVNGEFKPY
jgi:hypothetical protein